MQSTILIIAAVAVSSFAQANVWYDVADYRAQYLTGTFDGQTRKLRRADGWDYGAASGTFFSSLPWTTGHPCFGSAYGNGACRFVNSTAIHPDATNHEVAIKYTFKQSFDVVRIHGYAQRPETCGDGNCLKLFLWNGHAVQLLNTVVGLGSTVPFNVELNYVKEGWYVTVVSCARATTSGDSLFVDFKISAPCTEACYDPYCTQAYQGTCELGDSCTNVTAPTNICNSSQAFCDASEADCQGLDAECESSGMPLACQLRDQCYDIVTACQQVTNQCNEQILGCSSLAYG